MGHVQPQSITTPEPNERSALQLGELCWPRVDEPSFLFLFANQERFLNLSFSTPSGFQLLFLPVVCLL